MRRDLSDVARALEVMREGVLVKNSTFKLSSMIILLLHLFRLLPVLCGSHRHLALELLEVTQRVIGNAV